MCCSATDRYLRTITRSTPAGPDMDIAFTLLLITVLALWWLSAVNARDRARTVARAYCQRNQWQLLDQTVALRWIRPIRQTEGWRLQRHYRFEFSPDGDRRLRGEVHFQGDRVMRIVTEHDEGQMIDESAG